MRLKKQILVIDDETTELKKLREVLSKSGYGIITATDVEMGKQLSAKVHFDYILKKSDLPNNINEKNSDH